MPNHLAAVTTALSFCLFLAPATDAHALDVYGSSDRSLRVPVTTSSTTTLSDSCGNGTIDIGEDCDDDAANSAAAGAYCSTACTASACGAPVGKTADGIRTTDALFTLRAGVGLATCSPFVCDVDGNGKVNTTDALTVLKKSVGQAVTLQCPVPDTGEDITCVGRTFTTVGEIFAALAGDYDMTLDAGAGGLYTNYDGKAVTMRVLESFLGNLFVSTATNGSTSIGAAYYQPELEGYSWEDAEHEVNVFFGAELGTTKILQCDKVTGQLTFVVMATTGGPNFARLVTTP